VLLLLLYACHMPVARCVLQNSHNVLVSSGSTAHSSTQLPLLLLLLVSFVSAAELPQRACQQRQHRAIRAGGQDC
jgi:hypothetical protein